MTVRRPPALAEWLLNRLGYAGENPALMGDIAEEFQSGRSKAWFWRQTVDVIATGLRRKSGAARFHLAGLMAAFVLELPFGYLIGRVTGPPLVDRIAVILSAAALLVNLATGLFWRKGSSGPAQVVRRRTIDAAVVFVSADVVAAWFDRATSFSDLVRMHVGWLAALAALAWLEQVLARARAAHSARATLPSHELALPVRIRSGRTIVLKPEALPALLFDSGDFVLSRVLRKAPSIAVLRRAIWLGCARNYQADLMGDSPAVTLSELTELITEAARSLDLAAVAAVPIPGEIDGVEHELVFVKA